MRRGVAAGLALLAAAPAFAAESESCQPSRAAMEGWDGVWMAEGLTSGLNGRAEPGQESLRSFSRFQGFDAPYNEEGRRRFEGLADRIDKAEQGGWGFPVMMSAPTPFEITVGLNKTTITGEYRDIRVIYTDGRGHDPDGWPTIFGDSVGCWEGNELVAETTMVHYTPEFNVLAAPLSDDAVFKERYRLVGHDRLELDAVVTDPATLSEPWVIHVGYFKHELMDRVVIEGTLLENNRVLIIDGEYAIAGVEGGLAEEREAPAAGE
jgi:hypothetical protein